MSWGHDSWAGYIKFNPNTGFNSIGASWIVPAIQSTPSDSTAQLLIWIGLGGGQSFFGQPEAPNDLIQVGTGAYYDNSKNPGYYAFWETFPSLPIQPLSQSQYPVKPGDKIEADIFLEVLEPIGWVIEIVNTTQGWRFVNSPPYNTSIQTTQTAEFIVEAPQNSNTVGRKPLPLPNYGEVTFFDCDVDMLNPNFDYNKDSGFMYDYNFPFIKISVPSQPDSDGDGFTVAYGDIVPSPPPS
ncbi:G1 family glutamic endopeptidase [Bacillus paramycoides]|uniref:G1 family glutamic endopeptidase n=1 Tax=Bacillus paramycoides TaxID=2026194 RepID=UPI003D0551A6